MTKQERPAKTVRDTRRCNAALFGLIVIGFVCPAPSAFAASVEPVSEQSIVVHQPNANLANPFKLGLPRYMATKLARFNTYRSMLANDDMSRLNDSVVRELQAKVDSARNYIISTLPLYDLTEDASMYLAVAMSEDPAQNEIGHAGTFSLIRELLSRPMSKTNENFVRQLRGYLANQAVRHQLANLEAR
jgi:hypothetical protein